MGKKLIRSIIILLIILELLNAVLKLITPFVILGVIGVGIAFIVTRIKKSRNEFYFDNGINSTPSLQNKNSVMFSNSNIVATEANGSYDIMFGNGVIDLTKIPAPTEKSVIEINSMFGKSLVKLNPNIPAVIRTSCAFGKADLPNGTSINFGDYTYKTSSFNENEPYIIIKADAAFGSMEIVEGL